LPLSTTFPYTTLFRSIRGILAAYPQRRCRRPLRPSNSRRYSRFRILAPAVPRSRRCAHSRAHPLNPEPVPLSCSFAVLPLSDFRSEEHTSELQSRENL